MKPSSSCCSSPIDMRFQLGPTANPRRLRSRDRPADPIARRHLRARFGQLRMSNGEWKRRPDLVADDPGDGCRRRTRVARARAGARCRRAAARWHSIIAPVLEMLRRRIGELWIIVVEDCPIQISGWRRAMRARRRSALRSATAARLRGSNAMSRKLSLDDVAQHRRLLVGRAVEPSFVREFEADAAVA